LVEADQPGEYRYTRQGEILRCPWHGWEFDIRTGQSWCDPARIKARAYPVEIAPGQAVVQGPYVAETVPVTVEQDYVVVDA
jgi:3-phenylpropionate/trans-cinnamate dioxygenase ferredoxin subunit